MYSIRDLLVCGPVVFATLLFRDAGWVLPLVVGVLVYGSMRFLTDLIGVEQAVRDQREAMGAVEVAQRAEKAARARTGAKRPPGRPPR